MYYTYIPHATTIIIIAAVRLNYPASHDVPYDMVRGIGLDGIGVCVRDGDMIASIQDGRPAVVHTLYALLYTCIIIIIILCMRP